MASVCVCVIYKPEIEKILWKNQNGFWRNQSTTSQILIIHLRSLCKKSYDNILIYWFLPGIWLYTQREDGANSSSLWTSPKKTIAAVMMLYKTTKVKVCSLDWRHKLLWYCCRCSGYISLIPVHNLPRLWTLNIDRFDERKWLYTGKGKKQMILCTNYCGHELRRWPSTSGKYICPGWIPAASSGEGSRQHRALCRCRQNRIHVLKSKSKTPLC